MSHHTRAATALMLTTGLVCTGATLNAAAAEQPHKTYFASDPFTIVTTDTCGFPITVTSTVEGSETVFFDKNGDMTRVVVHATQRDEYEANGTTLPASPYTYNLHVLFDDNGEVAEIYATGVIVRVPLPDGSTFRSAGRLDVLAEELDYYVLPTTGGSKNYEEFCAALA